MSIKEVIRENVSAKTWTMLQTINRPVLATKYATTRFRNRIRDRFYYTLNRTQTCNVHEKSIKINVSNYLEHYRAKTYSTKEPETLEWLDQHFKEGDVLFDIGANIGLYSLYAAKSQPKATVYGFEPECQNFSRFCQNAYVNKLPNLIPCNIPLNDGPEFNYFYLSEFIAGSSLHNFGEFTDFSHSLSIQASFRQGALGTSLDLLVEQYKLPVPNLIKIDVDGIEEKIVTGMLKTAANPKVRGILIEITDKKGMPSPIFTQLKDLGFRVEKQGPVVRYGDYICQNNIFAR